MLRLLALLALLLEVDAFVFAPRIPFCFVQIPKSSRFHIGSRERLIMISLRILMHGNTVAVADGAQPAKLDLWDAHCHVHLSQNLQEIGSLQDDVSLCLMATRTTDWVDTLLDGRWAHEDHGDWEAELRALLNSCPRSCVGEIGLDKQWVPPGLEGVQYDAQLALFGRQLEIATELRRPVSLHCVAAYGDMFDILRQAPSLPPALYLHSFGGKAGILNSFVKMKRYGDRFYFGFSAGVNLRSPKTPDVIEMVPDERLLLESDLEDPLQVKPSLQRMLRVIADAKGWSIDQAATVTSNNARAFFSSR